MNFRFMAILLIILTITVRHVEGADVALKRWGVIASPEIREMGVSDLLTVELTERGFDLVEREQLDVIAKEFELTQLLGANTKERLNLGLRLKADALVLLSVVKYENVRCIKVVVSECRQGARLRLEILPVSDERENVGGVKTPQPLTAALTKESPQVAGKGAKPDDLARCCATIMGETREQFAGGVRQLFAVSPFHSKNLTHDFDYLQVGYSTLLGRAISQMPGTALVEIDEARAIRQELVGVGETQVAGRPAPLFIEGEFAMQGRNEAMRVQITLRLMDGKATQRTLEQADLTQEQAVDWLLSDVPREVATTREGKSDRLRLTRQEQFEKLTERAELFSATASFEEAASLREAALLLADNDVEQRFWLLADLRRRQNAHALQSTEIRGAIFRKEPFKHRLLSNVVLTGDEYRPRFEEARQYWLRMVDLANWLLSRQVMSRRETTVIFVTLAEDAHYVMSFLKPDERADIQNLAERLPWVMVEKYWQLDYKLRQKIGHPALHRAGFLVIANSIDEADDHDKWCQQLAGYWLSNLEQRSTLSQAQKLNAWTRFVINHVSRTIYSHHVFLHMCDYGKMRDADRIAKEKLLDSCEQIERTAAELLQAYGRCGRLSIRVVENVNKNDDTLKNESAEIRKLFLRHGASNITLFFLNDAEKSAASKSFKKHALSTNTLLGADPAPKIVFEPFPSIQMNGDKLRRVNEKLDVMWSRRLVSTLGPAGAVKLIFKTGNFGDEVLDVCFDEKCLWVMTLESGLRAYSHDGTLLCATFPSDAPQREKEQNPEPPLPPVGVDAGNRTRWPAAQFVTSRYLHSIGPGRCLAMGTYVPKGRLWFADVSLREQPSPEGRLSVKVVHECTTDAQESPRGKDDDPTESFKPGWMTELHTSTLPAQRLLLIGRPGFFNLPRFIRSPLVVDLETLKVAVYPGRMGNSPANYGEQRYAHLGKIVYPGGGGIQFLTPPLDKTQLDWDQTTLFAITGKTQQKKMGWWSPSKDLVVMGNQIECPGTTWWRAFPLESRIVEVVPERISPRYRFEHYGLSAHYGMVAWNVGDMLHRVDFDRELDAASQLSWRYPFVPETYREKHNRAIQAIRALGGQVDSVWPRVKLSEIKEQDWYTQAYLSDTWRGGDEGLKHLADLYELKELRLVKANVTDEGMKTICALTTLRRLNLEETRVTDAGLTALSGLKLLEQLRLDGPAETPLLTDAGVKIIHQLPKLNDLTIFGSGFTEATLETIISRSAATQLIVRPFETAISAAKMEQYQTKSRNFRIDRNLNLADEGMGW